jgi:hypothetical protein
MPAESVNIVRIKFKSVECEGYSGPKGEMRNEYKMFFWKHLALEVTFENGRIILKFIGMLRN